MNLNHLEEGLVRCATSDQVDLWIDENIITLRNYLYSLSQRDMLDLNIENFYFQNFLRVPIIKQLLQSEIFSTNFSVLLNLLALTMERLSYYGITSPIDNIRQHISEPSLKLRLHAISLVNNVNNVRIDYIANFDKIMGMLTEAEFAGTESYSQEILDIAITYYRTGNDKLKSRNYAKELAEFQLLFSNVDAKKRYDLLNFSLLENLVSGSQIDELGVENIDLETYQPSDAVLKIFKGINSIVLNHSRSRGVQILMGFSTRDVREDILKFGRTDFDTAYLHITPKEKVQLYCYMNMKKHFFSSYHAFCKMWPSLQMMFEDTHHIPVFIDLGCGPMTSGLALADVFFSRENKKITLHYFGIDISSKMLKMADQLRQSSKLFDSRSSFVFGKDLVSIELADLRKVASQNTPIFLNASYVFSSESLNILAIANYISKLREHFTSVFLIFQNPDRADRNLKWLDFKSTVSYKIIMSSTERIFYRTNQDPSKDPANELVNYEILQLTQ